MSEPTLYLIQSGFNATDGMLRKLEQIHAADDAIVLMGDAVLYADDNRIMHLNHIYVLETDAVIRVTPLPPHIQSINYAEFATLVLNFRRCISLK
ncbi:DsrH/TusB family sulfur metabolism protein [Acinetobacter sp. WZC-1]|uniref:DsrH/TusB family sulfur metabolism protein n=1 Tax=Acinetobacter sp. WZC-1 TaxID=3459034 RepID=UPI00403D8EA8